MVDNDGVVGFAKGSVHRNPDRFFPKLGEAFTGVASPAANRRPGVKAAPADSRELGFVQIGHTGPADFRTIIEHEAVAIGVAEILKVHDGATRT